MRTEAAKGGRVFVHAGRFYGEIKGAKLPTDTVALPEPDSLPARAAREIEGAGALLLLDPLSFPYEALEGMLGGDGLWSLPVVVYLDGLANGRAAAEAAGFLRAVLHEPLFGNLSSLDRIATADDALWEALRAEYGWSREQRVCVPEVPAGRRGERGALESVIRGLLESVRERSGLGEEKAADAAQRRLLLPRFEGYLEGLEAPRVVEVGFGAGRRVPDLDARRVEYVGLETDEEAVLRARENHPERRFERLGEDLRFPLEGETADLAYTARVMHRLSPEKKRLLLAEMWRVVSPGGRLVFLEDFVRGPYRGEEPVHVASVEEFAELLVEATAGRVVLEDFESVRYPGETFFRGGVMTVGRLGVPERW